MLSFGFKKNCNPTTRFENYEQFIERCFWNFDKIHRVLDLVESRDYSSWDLQRMIRIAALSTVLVMKLLTVLMTGTKMTPLLPDLGTVIETGERMDRMTLLSF